MSCLTIEISITPCLNITLTDKTERLQIRCSMLCSLSDVGTHEEFTVKDGTFVLSDGKIFKVLK